ncbi:MAG: glycerate kinase [Bacilli bacterium]
MKIVLAFNAFKQTMSASMATSIFQDQLYSRNINIVPVVVADGGEGSVQAMYSNLKGKKDLVKYEVTGPHLEKITAEVLISKNMAVLEVASVVGYKYKYKNDTPKNIYTLGIGEIIKKLLDTDIKDIYICMGDSISNDAGMGILYALGAKFYNDENDEIIPCGSKLNDIRNIDLQGIDPRVKDKNFIALSDVENILFGPQGASYIFASQKGAKSVELKQLDDGLRNVAKIFNNNYENYIGSGAAGGIGYAILCLGGKIQSGIETILNIAHFNQKIKNADFVITGEGQLDEQSFQGKTVSGIIKKTNQSGTKLIGFFGIITLPKEKYENLFYKVYEINYLHLPFDSIVNYSIEMYKMTIDKFIRNFSL